MTAVHGDFDVTMDELRAVVRFAADCAASILAEFETENPEDTRPRHALEAARAFADGAPRTNRQRTAAFQAHRAAKDAASKTAQLAAQACGDAAAAAYLHPIAKATQVGHILRSAACAAQVAELADGSDEADAIARIAERATAPVPAVLRRYPTAAAGRSRSSQLMSELDAVIRERD